MFKNRIVKFFAAIILIMLMCNSLTPLIYATYDNNVSKEVLNEVNADDNMVEENKKLDDNIKVIETEENNSEVDNQSQENIENNLDKDNQLEEIIENNLDEDNKLEENIVNNLKEDNVINKVENEDSKTTIEENNLIQEELMDSDVSQDLGAENEEFSIYVNDDSNRINSYIKNNINYLFIPKAMNLQNLVINYTGSVENIEGANVDKVEKKITGSFTNETEILITLSNAQQKRVIILQSDVPAIFVNNLKEPDALQQVSINDVNSGSKNIKYKATLNISGAENSSYNISQDIEFKGRGNTSWAMPKKSYQIKLNKKDNLLGIGKGKAKKWVLIANYADPTLLKNKIINDLCVDTGLAQCPNSSFADLYVDGNYIGNYLVSDKIEIGTTRLNLKDDYGVLAELDKAYYYEEEYNFTTSYNRNCFAIKEFANDDLDSNSKKKVTESFKNAMQNFEQELYSNNASWESISKLIDVNSFAKFYLINELTKNQDTFYSSTYFYRDGEKDVIHIGPTWDYDKDNFAGSASNDYTVYSENYMKRLCAYPEFAEIVNNIYTNELKSYFNNINVKKYAQDIKYASKINSIVWNSETSYSSKVENLSNWINARVKYFNDRYSNESNILYSTHIQDIGWQVSKKDGQVSGTEGQSKRLEAIRIYPTIKGNEKISLQYSTHIENIGWQDWKKDGELSGETGKGLRLEAIKIKIANNPSNKYTIQYRVHVQNIGWTNWASDGQIAGTEGRSLRLEAIEIRILEESDNTVSYTTHIQDIGWQENVKNGELAGTTGRSLRLEGIKINLQKSTSENAHIKYSTHIQDIGWQDWKYDGNMSGTEGQSKRLEAIKIQLEGLDGYTIKYRVHVQDIGWTDWVSNGEMAGTAGRSLRLEGIEIKIERDR